MKFFNFYLFEYALQYLLRYKGKNLFIFILLSFMVASMASVFFVSHALEYELNLGVKGMADITLQKKVAGMYAPSQESMADKLLEIDGVLDVESRVWGYYHFQQQNRDLIIVGLDSFATQLDPQLHTIADKFDLNGSSIVISPLLQKIFRDSYYEHYVNFVKPDGRLKKMEIAAIFKGFTPLEAKSMVVMSKESAREILGLGTNEVSSFFLSVGNPKEIPNIAKHLSLTYPNYSVLTAKDIRNTYASILNYKSGVFVAFIGVVLLTFFMIVYEKASGLSSEEKKEIGILKAIGWTIDDVLRAKFYEGGIIAFGAYLFGIVMALFYVYILGAPYILNIFVEDAIVRRFVSLPYSFDSMTLFLLFLLSVPIYIGATLIPSWRVATQDADEVMR